MNGVMLTDTKKQLIRLKNDRIVAGVCAGIANDFGVNPTLVQIAFAIVAFGAGSGVAAYIIA